MSHKAAKRARQETNAQIAGLVRCQPDLVRHLNDQVAFLRSSTEAYDAASEREAKRMAVAVRVLLHETQQSRSVLGQLGLREKIAYYDTAGPVRRTNLMPTMGLINLRVQIDEVSNRAFYAPRLDDFPPTPGAGSWIHFGEWWRRPVSRVPRDDLEIAREQYILAVANTEGGAHVDPFFAPLYAALSRDNAFRWTRGVMRDGKAENLGPLEGDPVFAAIRQISHELLKTLEKHLSQILNPYGPDGQEGSR